jgi:hypothetical protein
MAVSGRSTFLLILCRMVLEIVAESSDQRQRPSCNEGGRRRGGWLEQDVRQCGAGSRCTAAEGQRDNSQPQLGRSG